MVISGWLVDKEIISYSNVCRTFNEFAPYDFLFIYEQLRLDSSKR